MKQECVQIIGGGLFSTTIEIDENIMFEPSQSDIDIVEKNKKLIQCLKAKKKRKIITNPACITNRLTKI